MELWQLRQRQGLPLNVKINMSTKRIHEWYHYWHGNVYIAFSGGKDSTVLLDLVRSVFPDVPAVFVDTGLEYPEIREFVKTIDNVVWIKPKMSFKKVIETYGYPVVSKIVSHYINQVRTLDPGSKTYKLRMTGFTSSGKKSKIGKIPDKWMYLIDAPFKISNKCCDVLKKEPIHRYEKKNGGKGFVGWMASDGNSREQRYLDRGCNNFEGSVKTSLPMGFWNEEDVWEYIKKRNLPYSKIYDMGVKRTGCMFCMYGVHLEDGPNRFQCMKYTHHKLWEYSIKKLGIGKVLDYIGVNYGNVDLCDFMEDSNPCKKEVMVFDK